MLFRSLSVLCSSCRNNKSRKTVKLSPRSSVGQLAPTPLPGRYANSQTPMRPNRPHIPSKYTFQRARTQKKQHTRTSGVSAVLPPDCFPVTSITVPATVRSALPRPFRFGKALFRPRRPNPQEGKTPHVTISCQRQYLQGFLRRCDGKGSRIGRTAHHNRRKFTRILPRDG